MTERRWTPDAQLGDAEWEALARYAAGESTPDEATAIRAWIEQDPARAALLNLLENHGPQPTPAVDVEAAWLRVAARLEQEALPAIAGQEPGRPAEVVRFPTREERRRPVWRRTPFRAAAAILLLLAGTFFWRTSSRQPAVEPQLAAIQYKTAVGQTDTVRLGDGSLVVLAPLSRLTVDPAYNTDRRDVSLVGEALFHVEHDDRRPFRVRAGQAMIEDLGTVFTVSDGGASGVQVAVMEGMVKLQAIAATATGAVLQAGESGVLDTHGAVRTEPILDPAATTAWTQHRIVFRNATFDDVARELYRWYGLELRTSESAVRSQRLTATFAGESAQQVLNIVALAFGARIEQHGDTANVRALRPGERR